MGQDYWVLSDDELEKLAEQNHLKGCWNANGAIERNIAIEQLVLRDKALKTSPRGGRSSVKTVREFACLIISPSDVPEECAAIRDEVSAWNGSVGRGLNARIQLVHWSSDATPDLSQPPQAVINRQLVDECDFGIALFWARLGAPTTTHESGSVEEIYRLRDQGKRVLVYFSTAPIPQGRLMDDQYDRLQAVKERFRREGLLGTFDSTDELRRKGVHDLTRAITELLAEHTPSAPPASPLPPVDIRVSLSLGQYGDGPGGWRQALLLQGANHGGGGVVLDGYGIVLPDETFVVLASHPPGDMRLPHNLEPGRSGVLFLSAWLFAGFVKGKGYTGTIAIRGFLRDQLGNRYQSEPLDFDIEALGLGDLSDEERSLLVSASKGDGSIWKHSKDQGEWVSAGRTHLRDPGNASVAARGLEALESLVRRGFVRYESGDVYRLTPNGFEAGESLAE